MKKLFSIFFIVLMSLVILPFNVNALSILTLNLENNNNKITVSGTTEEGVLAVAVFVYSSDELVDMETCSSSDSNYSCELKKAFISGTYTVKVADYNGGDYISKDVKITTNNSNNDAKEDNPKTLDNVLLYIGLGSVSLIGILGCGVYLKKKRFN